MKKIKVMALILAMTTAAVLAGCSKKTSEPVSDVPVVQLDLQNDKGTSETPVSSPVENTVDTTPAGTVDTTVTTEPQITVVENKPVVENPPAEPEKPVQEATADVIAKITLNVTYANSEVDLIEVMDIQGVKSAPGETQNVIYGKDDNNNFVYKRTDSAVTDAAGGKTVTVVYEFYTLKYDFDFRMDPLNPENGTNIQTINGNIINGGKTTNYTYENVGVRGQTGIWYAGICSCRGGVLGDYIVY